MTEPGMEFKLQGNQSQRRSNCDVPRSSRNIPGRHTVDQRNPSLYKVCAVARNSMTSVIAVRHRLTAAVLAVLMAALGWFVRSESAHDHLHFRPTARSSLAAKGKLSGRETSHASTTTPRWLKLGPVPGDAAPPGPAGPHRHRSLAFDSLAAGQWCGLFVPVAVPILDLPAVVGLMPHQLTAPLRTHWLLLPGRAPPVCA